MTSQQHLYINLKSRKDRNTETIRELKSIGLKPNRFEAIKHDKGIIGCTKSHLEAIKLARTNDWPYVAIFEDDVKFLKPKATRKLMNKYADSRFLSYDVLLLGGNNAGKYDRISKDLIKVSKVFTTTAYIVKKHYYDTLIENLQEAYDLLVANDGDRQYSLDVWWHRLQEQDTWLMLTPLNVVQRADYSDIEDRDVDYEKIMRKL